MVPDGSGGMQLNDPGPNTSDGFTNVPNPVLRVTNVVEGAMVSVAGNKYNGNTKLTGSNNEVSQSEMVPAGATHVDFPLTGITEGVWWFTASQEESGKPSVDSAKTNPSDHGSVKLEIVRRTRQETVYYTDDGPPRIDGSPKTGTARSKSVEINPRNWSDGSSNNYDFKYILLLHDGAACPVTISDFMTASTRAEAAMSGTGLETTGILSGNDEARRRVVYTKEANNDKWVCAISYDVYGNNARLSPNNPMKILQIDRTGPKVNIALEAAAKVRPNSNTIRPGATPTITFTTGEEVRTASNTSVNFNTIGITARYDDGTAATLSPITPHGTDANTWTATLTVPSSATTGNITISVPGGSLRDVLDLPDAAGLVGGNVNNDPSGTDGANGRLVVAIEPLNPSAALTSLAYTGTDHGSIDSTSITYDTSPSFTVDGTLVVGATVGVIAAHSNGTDTVVKTRMVPGTGVGGADPPDDLDLTFDGSGCLVNGTIDNSDDSCELETQGTWSFSAYQEESNKGRNTYTPTPNALSIVLDTIKPVVTAALGHSIPTLTQTFTATATDTHSIHTFKSASSLLASGSTCATSAPSGAHDYTAGQAAMMTASNQTDNGKIMCFWATDAAGNTGVDSVTSSQY